MHAHHGVLFLDELAEFQPGTLQALRQPLEQGRVVVTRAQGTVTYPATFQLVAASNPCPCGWLGDGRRPCRCSENAVGRYQRALSGPLLDRIDLQVAVPRAPLAALAGEAVAESTAAVRERVLNARQIQWTRQSCLNCGLQAGALRAHAPLRSGAQGAGAVGGRAGPDRARVPSRLAGGANPGRPRRRGPADRGPCAGGAGLPP